jgi:hypothetical protein
MLSSVLDHPDAGILTRLGNVHGLMLNFYRFHDLQEIGRVSLDADRVCFVTVPAPRSPWSVWRRPALNG